MDDRFHGEYSHESHQKNRAREQGRDRARALGPRWTARDTFFLLMILAVTALICWAELSGLRVTGEGGPVPAPSGTRRVR